MEVVFAGTPGFAARHLEALIASNHTVRGVVTQPDKPGKRGNKLLPSPVKEVALASQLTVIQPRRLTAEDLAPFEADILVVVAFGQILRPPVLALPPFGCINVHASLLPRWRGAAPVQRAILAGDSEFGVTLIQMDKGLDTGDVLASTGFPLAPRETAGSLFSRLEEVGPPLLISTLDRLQAGGVTAVPQDESGVTYAHKIEKHEAAIDWRRTAMEVDRQVRAFSPDPVAFTWLGDMRIRIHEGEPVHSQKTGTPGQVLDMTRQGIDVATGDGGFRITRIQIPVGKGSVLSPADVLNGRTDLVFPGTCFSSPDTP